MDQETTLNVEQVEHLLSVMKRNGKTAIVDWVNRTISVLSEEKTNPNVNLSTGPMVYQDVIFCITGFDPEKGRKR